MEDDFGNKTYFCKRMLIRNVIRTGFVFLCRQNCRWSMKNAHWMGRTLQYSEKVYGGQQFKWQLSQTYILTHKF